MKPLLISVIFLFACTTYKQLPMWNLHLGMTKPDVFSTLGRQPDNLIGSKSFSYGVIEVVQYSRYTAMGDTPHDLAERYWLYFLNDSLRQWGRPGDWKKEADRIYEIRYR